MQLSVSSQAQPVQSTADVKLSYICILKYKTTHQHFIPVKALKNLPAKPHFTGLSLGGVNGFTALINFEKCLIVLTDFW